MDNCSRPRILVIEPDPSIRALLTAVIRRGGLEVDCAADRDAALARSSSGHYTAVVLEPRMPGGDVLLHELRAAESGRRPAIIVATAPDAWAAALAESNGVDALLTKPFDLSELSAAIAACASVQESAGSGTRT